jgi:hypothetical protein
MSVHIFSFNYFFTAYIYLGKRSPPKKYIFYMLYKNYTKLEWLVKYLQHMNGRLFVIKIMKIFLNILKFL